MPAVGRIPESLLPRMYRGETVLNIKEPEWLLEDFIQKGGLTLVYSEPGGGKSLVMQAWANILAADGFERTWRWAGRERIKQANVLYIMAEGQGGLRGRLMAWKQCRGVEKLPNVFWIMEPVSLWRPSESTEFTPVQKELVEVVEDGKFDVIFLDTLAATYGAGNENTQQDMNQYLQVCAAIQRLGCAVVIAHHTAKGSKTLRGSTVLAGAADTVIFLNPDFDKQTHALLSTTLKAKKQKDGMPFQPVTLVPTLFDVDTYVGQSLTLGPAVGGHDTDSTLWKARLANREERRRQELLGFVAESPGRSATAIRKAVGGKRELVADSLKGLVDDGSLVHDNGYFVPTAKTEEIEEL